MELTLPQQFERFGEARKAGFLRVKALKEAGGRVAGTFCTFTPLEILDGAGFVFDPAERVARLDTLRQSLLANHRAGARPVPGDAKRILITGCPMGGVLEKTVGVIERSGGTVVCFENCSGVKAAAEQVNENAPDIVEAIAKRYLNIGCAVMTPDDRRRSLLTALCRDYAPDGIVEVDLQSCTPYAVESFRVRQWAKALGLSYLKLDTDYGDSDMPQLTTRLQAFLEML